MSNDLDMTRQPAQSCVCCGEATDAAVYLGVRKVPMCPACSIRFEDHLAEKHGAPLPCPPVLYRYRAPSDLDSGEDGSPSRFEQFLTTDQLWASNPTQFNDPYDCQFTKCLAPILARRCCACREWGARASFKAQGDDLERSSRRSLPAELVVPWSLVETFCALRKRA